jgi:hypothetical protein
MNYYTPCGMLWVAMLYLTQENKFIFGLLSGIGLFIMGTKILDPSVRDLTLDIILDPGITSGILIVLIMYCPQYLFVFCSMIFFYMGVILIYQYRKREFIIYPNISVK